MNKYIYVYICEIQLAVECKSEEDIHPDTGHFPEDRHIRFYSFNSFVDINECANNNGGCMQRCVNSVGTYHCECNIGYQLHNSDLHTCVGEYSRCLSMK